VWELRSNEELMSVYMLLFVIAIAVCKSCRNALVVEVGRTADDTTTPRDGHASLLGKTLQTIRKHLTLSYNSYFGSIVKKTGSNANERTHDSSVV
jgi:hypothetical protein